MHLVAMQLAVQADKLLAGVILILVMSAQRNLRKCGFGKKAA